MRRVWLAVVLLGGAGCLGRGYERVVEIHVEVLQSMAHKMCFMAQTGQPPQPEALPEFLYPSKRAGEVAQYFSRDASRESYRLFGQMLQRYEDTVHLVDAARTSAEAWRAQAAAVCEGRDEVERLAEQVRAALRREREG